MNIQKKKDICANLGTTKFPGVEHVSMWPHGLIALYYTHILYLVMIILNNFYANSFIFTCT